MFDFPEISGVGCNFLERSYDADVLVVPLYDSPRASHDHGFAEGLFASHIEEALCVSLPRYQVKTSGLGEDLRKLRNVERRLVSLIAAGD